MHRVDLGQYSRATTVPSVRSSDIQEIDFPLPPLAEQQRIVAKIEALFTQLDAGAAALKRIQAGLKRYKASVLKTACEGRLVPQDPADGSAQDLLVQIAAERRAKWEAELRAKGKDPKKEKYVEPAAPDTSELPDLPQGWVWATVEQLATAGTGATPLRGQTKYWQGGTIPWITSGALNDLYVEKADEFITFKALAETNTKLFPIGTLLIAMYGEGKTRGKVSELRIEAATNQACAALVFDMTALLSKPYLKLYFQKNYEDIRKQASGGVQPNLNLSIIRQTAIPLPPLPEQHRIVAEVERRLAAAKALETAVEQSLARAGRLRQMILQRAFEGRLVPQDPNDEPAERLLERIQAARQAKAEAQRKKPVRQGSKKRGKHG